MHVTVDLKIQIIEIDFKTNALEHNPTANIMLGTRTGKTCRTKSWESPPVQLSGKRMWELLVNIFI